MSFLAKKISSNSSSQSVDCRFTAYPDSYDMPESKSFNQELVDNYVNQLVKTGSCPALFDCSGEPMSYEEAYKTVIETMTADAELRA